MKDYDITNSSNVKVGDWVILDCEGFAEVVDIHPVYYEVFDQDVYKTFEELYPFPEPGDELKHIGDLKYILLKAKVFCDFNGKLIRRNRMKARRKDFCGWLKPYHQNLLDKVIKNNPKEYQSFVRLKKDVVDYIEIRYPVADIETALQMPHFFEETIRPQLPDKFTSKELQEIMVKNNCPFQIDKPMFYGYYHKPEISLFLYYNVGEYSDKDTIYENLLAYYYGMHLKNQNEENE